MISLMPLGISFFYLFEDKKEKKNANYEHGLCQSK